MRKVLIVDGSAGERELLRVLLEHEGYEVFEAADGKEAVAAARETQPDLIMLNLGVSGQDGYTAVEEMRQDGLLKSRAIMAVIDGPRLLDRERLVNAGFSGYIAKPVVLRTLREQLTQLAILRQGA
jgi:two-component system cell cycle response regulator DivK